MDPWIVARCRRACRHQVMAWLVVLAAGLAFLGFQARYLRNFFAGPYAIDEAGLSAVNNPSTAPRFFVKVTPADVLDTGIQETTTETENGTPTKTYVSSQFWAARLGHRLLIVRAKEKPGALVTGQLEPMPDYLAQELFSGTDASLMRQVTYPMVLDTQGFRKEGYIILAVTAFFLWLMYIFLRRSLRNAMDPWQHPAIARVAKWGDVHLISAEVERDLREAARFRAHGITLADHYAVTNSFFVFNVLRMHDLLWAYKKITKRRVYFFIPAGKEFDAVLKFYGGDVSFRRSGFGHREEKVEEVLKWVAERAPWAIIGYSDELNTLFTKQTEEFARVVEQRREQLAAKA
jgi:hypothetical protein